MTNALQDEWEEKVRALTIMLSKKFAQPVQEHNFYEMHYYSSLAMEEKGFRYVYVQDENGRVLVDATEGSELLGEVLANEATRRALAAEDVIIQRQADIV
ncbi:MAG: hypothetical protein ACE5KK_05970, partial [Candidatus Brocadiales bacterium]